MENAEGRIAESSDAEPAPSKTPRRYGRADFWDERYFKNCEPFEWYHDYHALSGLLAEFCEKDMHILLIGCGASEMAADMYDDGYKSIMNLDISRVVIDEMQTRYADITRGAGKKKKKKKKGRKAMADVPLMVFAEDLGGVQWRQGDATDLSAVFDNQIFDVVIDKALLDAVYCSKIPSRAVREYLQEMDRIVKSTGLFFCVSFGLPENRLDMLENTDDESEDWLAWEVEVLVAASRDGVAGRPPKPRRRPRAARGDGSRRRRGCHVDILRGDWSRPPRLRRGSSVETGPRRRRGCHVDIPRRPRRRRGCHVDRLNGSQ